LVRLPLALRLVAAPHDGVDADVPVEGGGRQHRRVPGAPLDVEAPLRVGGQLVQNLSARPHGRVTGVIASCGTSLTND